jgi:glycogen operon protein
VKLIAEPWDIGYGGYELGDFPPGWSEWNGRYRDTVRDFWRGTEGMLGDFATRVTGSADLYGRGRRPSASINLITVHDGFTLADLTSYDAKHNEANGEDNRDGTDDNRSWNCGVEGPTDDPEILDLRMRQRRNMLATLLLSEGVPLLLGGDELARTQGGNNNAYCQDNDVSWVDWSLDADRQDLLEFATSLIRLRRATPGLRRRQFLRPDELTWYRPDGSSMTAADWSEPFARAVAAAPSTNAFVFFFNAWWEPLTFSLPPALRGGSWSAVIDTAHGNGSPAVGPTDEVVVSPRSLLLLENEAGGSGGGA